eukprot:scaffold25563_cov127-Cylindrotheca_fusiformis.AAC.3
MTPFIQITAPTGHSFNDFRNMDTVDEKSVSSSSEFDDIDIKWSINDSAHLARVRGVPLVIEADFDLDDDDDDDDEDLIEIDSVHLTRKRVPECVWRGRNKDDGKGEFEEESELRNDKELSSSSTNPRVRFGSDCPQEQTKSTQMRSLHNLQMQGGRELPVFIE